MASFDPRLRVEEDSSRVAAGCRVCSVGRHEPPSGLVRNMLEDSVAEGVEGGVTIDVMFAYSRAAVLGQAQEKSMRQQIKESLRLANRIYADSGTGVQFRMVALTEVDYEDAGDIEVDLNRLSTRHSSTEAIWRRREACLADVVCLLVESDNYWGGAIANRPTTPEELNRNFGHVVFYRADMSPPGLAHEFGHLFGCTHDLAAAGSDLLYPYAYGNHLEVEGIMHRTIMAYHPGVEVPLFSGSDLSYRNVPTAITTFGTQSVRTDNVRVIQNTARMLAGYYIPESSVGFASSVLNLVEGEAPTSIRIIRSGGLDLGMSVILGVETRGAEEEGDFVLSAKRVTFAPGDSLQEVELGIVDDETVERTESMAFTLRVVQRGEKVVRVGPNEQLQVFIHDNESVVSFDEETIRVSEETGQVSIPVSLNEHGRRLLETELSIAVPFEVADGSAKLDRDFLESSGDLIFTAEATEQRISVELLEDTEVEGIETFEIRLGKQTAHVQVVDNDGSGSRVERNRWRSSVNGTVWSIVPLPDGRSVIGGAFTKVDGRPRHGLARLHPDGSLDESFASGDLMAGWEQDSATYPPSIFNLLRLRSGKLLVMGHFTSIDGEHNGFVARLNDDGSLDPDFALAPGADSWVTDAVEQPDGKVIVVGLFHHFNKEPARGIARINPDGSLDSTFKINPGPSGWAALLWGICQQPDGKLIVTGFFGKYHDESLSNIARLNSDGTVDATFRTVEGNIGLVLDAAIDPDGGIYIHGYFERFNRQMRSRICRLLDDGTVDLSFNLEPALDGKVETLALAPNGDLILGGAFANEGEGGARHLLKVGRDGSIDPGFALDRGPDDHVYALAFSSDRSLLVGGRFQSFEELPDAHLTQLHIDRIEPLLTGVRRDGNELVLTLRGILGQQILLERSTSLKHWEPYREFRLDSELIQARVPISTDGGPQFIRLGSTVKP